MTDDTQSASTRGKRFRFGPLPVPTVDLADIGVDREDMLACEISDVVRRQIAADMQDRFDRMCWGAMTSNVAPEPSPPPFRLEDHLPKWEQMFREARRNQFVVIVDMALPMDAPLLLERTPCDGDRIEMSHRQALELHRHWPLKLHKVLSPERAEFVPVSGVFPEFVPLILPAPPYEMPDSAEIET